jgi:hypothetical protein
MTAGAMQPDTREPNWKPRYNLLEIKVVENEQRNLNVSVYPRSWKEEDQKFQPEFTDAGNIYKEYNLPIDNWSKNETKEKKPELTEKEMHKDMTPVTQTSYLADSARKLTYRFLRLPYHKRIGIASQLDLLEDEDKGLQDSELFQRFFKRAKDKNKLADLWDAVATTYTTEDEIPNPYRE